MLHKIAEKYGIELILVESGDKYCEANGEENYINRSYCSDGKIWIGIYDNHELKTLSFFHEMGHILDNIDWSVGANKTTQYKAEKKAWELGYALAKKYGVSFSDNAKQWGIEQLETYNKTQD